MRLASWDTTAIITVGSVRGKERFEMPCRVAQGGRSAGFRGFSPVVAPWAVGREAQSVGGQVRLVPAWMERVGWPQPAQKRLRAFQSMRARAWA